MKTLLAVSALSALLAVSVHAQGTIKFNNDSTTKINTNAVVGGAATGVTGAISPQYRFALFRSTNATSVNGQVAAIAGGTNVNYAFSDSNWTLVSYGSNSFGAGQFVSANADLSGRTPVPGVAGGTAAQFVVIGWSQNAGTTIASVQSWFNGGNPGFSGWIGQSDVSGAITLGTSTAATLFSTSAPGVKGFILGRVDSGASVAPVITAQPSNKTVTVGSSTSFSVTAYGTPSPTYQWYYNTNTLLTGATSSTLSLTNVQLTDAGTYSVLITNTAGSTNSIAATLTVTAGSGNGYVAFANTGSTAISTNTVVGGPATGLTASALYYFALYRSINGTSVSGQAAAIAGGTNVNYAFNDTNWTLVTYGSNFFTAGQLTSGSGTVLVPGVTGGSTAQFVGIGWSANAGTTVATLKTWFNGGNPASTGWIGQSDVSGAITLGTSAGTAATLFSTSAPGINGFILGRIDAGTQTPVAPVITAQPADKTVPVGGTTSFSVAASGTPSPTYQWYYNTSTLITGATGSTLSLTNVQMSAAGTYSVLISNSAGSTNSFAATLTVTAPSGNGLVVFANTTASATKIYTNTAVGGPATGLTGSTPYYFALYGSTNATSVSGQTTAIVGGASTSYAFNDGSWTLAAYGTNYVMTTSSNYFLGMFKSANANGVGRTPVLGIPPGVPARLVVIGWSGNIGTTIADVQSWFNGGSPASDGWIGQSAVSGSLVLGDGASIPTPPSFGAIAPYLQGFTLGLVSPVPHASYSMPAAPPALVQTTKNGSLIRLSWPTAAGNFGVQSADGIAGPWSDTGYGVTSDGTTSSADVPSSDQNKYFRLVAQ